MAERDEGEELAERFEAQRAHLRGVAYRMLGSLAEADDAVQQAWLRVSRAGAGGVENLGGWLTTVVARVSLDMLRARESRREEPLGEELPRAVRRRAAGGDPEREAELADSVGLALLVVLDTLAPAERLAFVLHDVFAVPFEEIGRIVERSPAAARQLASRARRRVQGAEVERGPGLARQREVVDAFLAAVRGGDMGALLGILDPGVVARADRATPRELQGAEAVAARALRGGARFARPALVDGAVGVVIAPRGRLLMVLRFTIADGRIVEIEQIADPARLRQMDLAVLDDRSV